MVGDFPLLLLELLFNLNDTFPLFFILQDLYLFFFDFLLFDNSCLHSDHLEVSLRWLGLLHLPG